MTGLILALLVSNSLFATSAISAQASKNIAKIDALDVTHHWPAGVHVHWQSGIPDGRPEKSAGKHTHCSAFVASAAETLGIYLLRPPEHAQILLANAQADWLASSAGREKGWTPLQSDYIAAQSAANRGMLVVAVYKNHHATSPGHIAVVRPSTRADSEVEKDGPEITQAGLSNYTDTVLSRGFAGHKKALRDHEILFFQHEVR